MPTNKNAYGFGRSVPRDPFWMTAKYPGKAKDGTPFKKGDRIFYFPYDKTILVGEAAEKAAARFHAEVADEDFYNYRGASDESVQAGDLDDACWEDYEAVGLKPGAGGRMVPNCVPVKSAAWKAEAASLEWSEPGEAVVAVIKAIAKKYKQPTTYTPKMADKYGNELSIQYTARNEYLDDDWADGLDPRRVSELLAKYRADDPQDAVEKARKAVEQELETVGNDIEAMSRKIDQVGGGKFRWNVVAGETYGRHRGGVVNLTVRGPFTTFHKAAAWKMFADWENG